MRTSVSGASPTFGRTGRLVTALAGLASLGSLALSMPVHADDQDTIDYREHVMKTMGDQVNAIQLLSGHKLPADDNSNFLAHVKILAMSASVAKAAFTPKVQGGQAKPNVWTNWADFSKRLDTLAANTADLEKTAESGGIDATAAKLQAALTCKSCHDQYREQKKQQQ